ncbi:hypothetical protein D1841_04665 [Neglecta sp. X4]|uniref:S-layer homology domain-containing protein n=1 Tax=unclassified Neglectibacter TaxID=2632164 RepID=UPI00136AD601|nr:MULTISPECIES: S-layer homology domain-containing protein [unclassified Neglectibacter]NBI16449.1 hypothetical protein [Neglectibacter sp. 59]NBJ72624.1 hypothetical protein [Neglectibacter sp. X4]NCE80396.1 hypothetical protein [Neglectibacter sp. X58]
MTGIKQKANIFQKLLCLLLAAAMLVSPAFVPKARAAGAATGIGLAEHGIKAHAEGWKYQYGGKGEYVGGTRVSDCAGLIYAYFSDMGMRDPAGNCTGHVNLSKFHGTISECLPNIHGLLLTMPEYNAPETGIYSHIGIYIGGGMATDNSDYTYNMRRLPVNAPGRDWNAWHLLDNGLLYPSNGWYEMDQKMTHYTSYQYDTDTVIDGLTINSEGYAVDEAGEYLPVDETMLSNDFVPASVVADHLATLYSGKDNTHDLVYGVQPDPDDPAYNGIITGTGVNLRAGPTTQSSAVRVLHKGDLLKITGEVEGMEITSGGKTSSLWYAVTTATGKSGYVCSLFVSKRNVSGGELEAPVIESDGYSVTITSKDEDADIYYTTDGTEPTEDSTPYVGPVYMTGCTYKAVAIKDGAASPAAVSTVLSNGTVFTDFTYADWYAGNIDQAVTYGLFKGVGENKFEPNSRVQRGQFVLVLANLAGVNLDAYSGVTSFADVSPSAYYAKAVQWASETGITNGDGTGFRPTDSISRQEMCVLIYRFLGLRPVDIYASFADDGKIASWAKDAVYTCRGAGIINGVGDNQFDPLGTATRAQACVVAVNCYNQ